MQKRGTVILTILLSLAIVSGLFYFAYINNWFGLRGENLTRPYSLYFLDSTKTKLVKEERKLQLGYGRQELEDLVQLLIEGPLNNVDLKSAFPEKVRLLSLDQQDSLASVNFSKEYYNSSTADDILAAFTVVSTLCDTTGVDMVTILVDGQELIGSDKKPLGALSRDDIVFDVVGSSPAPQNTVQLSLYFPASTDAKLYLESRSVEQKNKEQIEKLIITELLKGPGDKQLTKAIPAEVKLISAETKDFVCFINLSKDFIDKHFAGSSAELMCVYSIVNSLCELDSVRSVQFLIEGQKVETFGEMLFNEPFTQRTDLIVQQESQ